MKRHLAMAGLAAAVLAIAGLAAEDLVSGPAPGKSLPGPFSPLNVTGKRAGEKNCLV